MKLIRRALFITPLIVLTACAILLALANRVPTRPVPAGILWEARFNGPANDADAPLALEVDSTGDVIVIGSSYGDKGGAAVAIKYHGASGNVQWLEHCALPGDGNISLDSTGNYLLAGSEGRGFRKGPLPPPFSGPDTDVLVMKYSGKDGKAMWKKTHDGRHHDTDWAQGIALDPAGDPVVAGFTPDDTRYYGYLAKFGATDGSKLWERCTEDPPAAELWHGSFAMGVDRNGDVVFASSTKTSAPGFSGEFFIEKIDGTHGTLVWTKRARSDGASSDSIVALDLDPEGNVIVSGYSLGDRGRKVVTTKLASDDGASVWSVTYVSGFGSSDQPSGVVVDAEGNVFVSVVSRSGSYTGSGYEGHTLKYSGDDGRLRWDQKRLVPANSPTVAQACAWRRLKLGPNGAVILYGNQWNGKSVDFHLSWLSESDGRMLRQLSYDGPAGDHDLISDIALAPDGGLVVVGSSSNCASWLKPAKGISYRIGMGANLADPLRESNRVNDEDRYNYDIVTVKYPPLTTGAKFDDQRSAQ